jgi:hypothetical protein
MRHLDREYEKNKKLFMANLKLRSVNKKMIIYINMRHFNVPLFIVIKKSKTSHGR